MGLFRDKGKNSSLPMLYPAGFEPVNREAPGDARKSEDLTSYFTITPQQRELMGIPPEDLDSYLEAMYARQLGLDDAETILAWGPVYVEPPMGNRTFDGTAVVTEKSLMVWWLPSNRGLIHVMHNPHDSISGLQIEGPTAAHFYWEQGIYADNVGKHVVSNPNIYMAARFGKQNGHDNRRAFCLYYTFAHYVKQQGLG
jgi:hypothetical protein